MHIYLCQFDCGAPTRTLIENLQAVPSHTIVFLIDSSALDHFFCLKTRKRAKARHRKSKIKKTQLGKVHVHVSRIEIARRLNDTKELERNEILRKLSIYQMRRLHTVPRQAQTQAIDTTTTFAPHRLFLSDP